MGDRPGSFHTRKCCPLRRIFGSPVSTSSCHLDPGRRPRHRERRAARDAKGSYALIYSPSGKPISVDLTKLSGAKLRANWFDPRDGTATPIGEFQNAGIREFMPPTQGDVAVLGGAAPGRPALRGILGGP